MEREELVRRHNVVLREMDVTSPLTVGNGDFAFTADVTGLQSLYREYGETFPLCTMSNFAWHSEPDEGRTYTLADLEMTQYHRDGRTFRYPVEKTPQNARVYEWLRRNPHKYNVFRLGYEYQGREIAGNEIGNIFQELDLFCGCLTSRFCLANVPCQTRLACAGEEDALGVCAKSRLLAEGSLSLVLSFPYGSPKISGSDWNRENDHTSTLSVRENGEAVIARVMDGTRYEVVLSLENGSISQEGAHRFVIRCSGEELHLAIRVHFPEKRNEAVADVFASAKRFWKEFWKSVDLVDVKRISKTQAEELERREILSLYLLRIQSAGSLPPAETGLSCNSWYGKFHLEMHFWHAGWMPLYGQGVVLEKSLRWYREHLPKVRENAARNGYLGARWPKMVGPDGEDSPSNIAPLLIWQQPHIIWMLELLYQKLGDEVLKAYWETVQETADFMADFAQWNEERGCYELCAPLIPAQETHRSMETKNPVFELEYWREGLTIAVNWARRLQKEANPRWIQVAEKMAKPLVVDGVYLATDTALDTYENHAKDHPSMLMAFGLLDGALIDPQVMEKTLEKVLKTWDFDSAWGWDFAVMAMTAYRLNQPELAVKLLLMDTQKNQYVASGNNRQGYRKDLPLYLPGNGAFLYALGVMGECKI